MGPLKKSSKPIPHEIENPILQLLGPQAYCKVKMDYVEVSPHMLLIF